jgi:hypothetical protein
MLPAAQAPAVPLKVAPAPRLKRTLIPAVLSVAQVPVVSPATVIVFCSHVFAALTVNVNGYERLAAPL